MHPNELTEIIIGGAIEVRRVLGPGPLESACETCLCRELELRSGPQQRQVQLPVCYKGINLDGGHRLDPLAADRALVEGKAVDAPLPVHEAQLPTYLRLTNRPVGLLVNFHAPTGKQGLRRLANNLPEDSASSAPLR